MSKGLEQFLEKIANAPNDEFYIDRFLALLVDEDIEFRQDYLLKLARLIVHNNPTGGLRVAYQALQETQKVKSPAVREIELLNVVSFSFKLLGKNEKAELIAQERLQLLEELRSSVQEESFEEAEPVVVEKQPVLDNVKDENPSSRNQSSQLETQEYPAEHQQALGVSSSDKEESSISMQDEIKSIISEEFKQSIDLDSSVEQAESKEYHPLDLSIIDPIATPSDTRSTVLSEYDANQTRTIDYSLKSEDTKVASSLSNTKIHDFDQPWILFATKLQEKVLSKDPDFFIGFTISENLNRFLKLRTHEYTNETILKFVKEILSHNNFEALESSFKVLGLGSRLEDAWLEFLDQLLEVGEFRFAHKVIKSSLSSKSKLAWVELNFNKLKICLDALGYHQIKWEPEDGVKVLIRDLAERPLPKASLLLATSDT